MDSKKEIYGFAQLYMFIHFLWLEFGNCVCRSMIVNIIFLDKCEQREYILIVNADRVETIRIK